MTLKAYSPLIARFKRSLYVLRLAIDSSSSLQTLSKRTRIPTKTLLPTIVLGTALVFLVLPKHTTNALAVFLPLRRTINALDDEHMIDDRRKMWDYWFILCTTFVAELAGVENVVGAYWPLKLATVLCVLMPEFGDCELRLSETGETSARQMDTDSIDRNTFARSITPIKALGPKEPSTSPTCSQWSACNADEPLVSEALPTSESLQPKRFGTAKTLDDLLELDFDDSGSEYAESPVDSATLVPALLPVPNQKPSFTTGSTKTLDDLLKLEFGAEVQRGQAHCKCACSCRGRRLLNRASFLPPRRERMDVPLSPDSGFEVDTTQ